MFISIIEISVTIHVTSRQSQSLLLGSDALDDIVILRLENGRDYFIPINGNYQRSAFGASIEYLINCTTPIRTMQLLTAPPIQTLAIPKELWRIVDFIYKNGLQEEGLFTTNGVEDEIKRIKENIDCGTEFQLPLSIHSMCEVFIYFIKNLAEPVSEIRRRNYLYSILSPLIIS